MVLMKQLLIVFCFKHFRPFMYHPIRVLKECVTFLSLVMLSNVWQVWYVQASRPQHLYFLPHSSYARSAFLMKKKSIRPHSWAIESHIGYKRSG